MEKKQRVFSGIQPSGSLHIGNFLGAINQWVDMQDTTDAFLCIVDQHAITVPQDPMSLRARTLEIAKIYLASGIDPTKATLFVQSHVPEHTELGWILNTLTKNGDLTKMTQFKDKSEIDFEECEISFDTVTEFFRRFKEQFNSVGVGLFDYPVLMAGDILLYDTELVPVGDDQVQHVELTRTLARRFNKRFGNTFIVPKSVVNSESARIMALDEPTKKMSKSAKSEYNAIALMDDPEIVRKKIMKAVTDSGSTILYTDDKPALKNLINIYALFGNITTTDVIMRYEGKGYVDFKRDLGDIIASFLIEFQKKFKALSDEETLKILCDGAEKAREFASMKMRDVRDRVGFLL